MNNELLFPEARQVLDEAADRHRVALSYACEAIELAHRAHDRQRNLTSGLVPGIPHVRRVRNEISDDCWRFLKSIGQPLVDEGLIREFTTSDGGDVMILPDGLHLRIKKGDRDGTPSNYPTPKISRMDEAASRYALFPDATELDLFILDGHWLDVVFVVGDAMAEYTQVGLRFAAATLSPFGILDQLTDAELGVIAPSAFDLVVDARHRLVG